MPEFDARVLARRNATENESLALCRRTSNVALNLVRGLLCLVLLCGAFSVVAQDDDDEELHPGLVAKSLNGSNLQRERIADLLVVDADSLNSTTSGASSIEFAGQILIQHEGPTQWHFFGQGQIELTIAGRTILKQTLHQLEWVSVNDSASGLGVHPIELKLKRVGSRAELRAFWSSSTFALEPIPAHVLLHVGSNTDRELIDRGRRLFAAYRCGQCHAADPYSIKLDAPDLRFTSGLNRDWLHEHLAGTHAAARMPSFDFKSQEVADVSAFLNSKSLNPPLEKLPNPDKKRTDELDRTDGLILLKSTGCLACHALGDLGTRNEFGGADLAAVGSKRSIEWFVSWLNEPEKLNPSHRMPTFRLTAQERRQLALALSSLKSKTASSNAIAAGNARRGADLLTDASCTACHHLPGVDKPVLKTIPSLTQAAVNWNASCLSESADRSKGRPSYRQTDESERRALRAYVETLHRPAIVPSLSDRGAAVLEAKNCLNCHPRGTSKGLATLTKSILAAEPTLAAFAPTLVPPHLTAVGDKLLDDALRQALSGEQQVRKPWLKVRMPKFKHSESDKSALAAYFIGQDRIPNAAPGSSAKTKSFDQPVDDQTLVLGQTLVGPKGFSCIACHQMGNYVPKNAAIGTRGSDLLALRSRLREPFFERWVHAPLRVVPGMEMPSYGTRPIKGVLNDDARLQIATLWRTLNDARFQAPTDIGSVEQYVFVEPQQPARVIRDVFTNPEANGGGYIARAFAVGLHNQHNVMIDLDSLSVRGWTFGDLARQRTVGKSWYWDLAGSAVVPSFSRESDYLLLDQNSDRARPIAPTKSNGTVGRLVSYRPYQSGIEFVFDLNFILNDVPNSVRVTEQLLPRLADASSTGRAGFERRISVNNIPTGFGLQITRPKLSTLEKSTLGQPSIVRRDEDSIQWIDVASSDGQSTKGFVQRERSAVQTIDGSAQVTLLYEARLQAPPLGVVPKPMIPGIQQTIESTPGFVGVQLPLPQSIMPTALAFLADGSLAVASLKGHVYLTRDSNKDGLQDSLQLYEEGLAAPYGLIADGDSLLVAHKPEVLRLRDTDGDGRVDERSVFATGWGFNDNYHDWTCGIVRDSRGNLFVGTGSDYSQPGRPKELSRWRGKILKLSSAGEVEPFAHAFRYPTGLAIDARDRLFATDNQGEQNCFNEINYIREGARYGVESLHERQPPVDPGQAPAIQVPHPWTRSVNGLVILPERLQGPAAAWAGHGLGCEYNTRFLVRFTYHEVNGVMQGAIFPFSKPNYEPADKNFLGPISIAVSPSGDLYVGSIHDSGWLGGLNVGSIVKLTANSVPPGLKDIRATKDGFELSFFLPVDQARGTDLKNYSISGYTRVWQGTYETPDSGRFQPTIESVVLSNNGLTARLKVDRLKTGFIYEFNCPAVFGTSDAWPTSGSYTLHRQP